MSLNDLFNIQNMTQDEAYEYISLLFDGYLAISRNMVTDFVLNVKYRDSHSFHFLFVQKVL